MGRIFIGLVIGIILVPLAVLAYFKMGRVPVAVNDPPFPNERLFTSDSPRCADRSRNGQDAAHPAR